ncbi:MAG: dTDP-glucose 4,6-dehydratase [Candidatus Uhrbacteria bacterium GW2011_GWF2_39_13]|uniref:dTDP-glucose 4,6-dehydratase n=1 Tax=Candidatus Uhrbacteria bacterium GW2011_GWF2_39_13 TaxID=1618995 RepID=A0A0G0MK85_9BACT|nr:MAG: dTDP-glucose 4,6-dehydratase [Candidatus Uhrbacteria bacterium GW2011_GWF2_39_13]HAU65730.1 dTDP-glucose 4,6-dehydratase [Candidatus Uhrbacteria bacterium]
MKILLTGGAGFMGSNMIHYLLREYQDIEVINFDDLTYAGNLESLTDVAQDPRYTFVKGNIIDTNAVETAIQGVDVVINYAAETHVDRSILDPRAFIDTNIYGVYNILEAVRKHKIHRYIQISTDEVFGAVLEGESDEQSKFEPRSPYSASKAAGDHLCAAYAITYGVPVIVTHSCNFYGPYQFPEKLIPLFTMNLIEGKKVPVYGDGQQVREWIFTHDHCRAVDVIMRKGNPGEIYNIGTGYRVPNLEVIKQMLDLTGRGEEAIEYVLDRPGHDRRYAVNSNKLRTELGWEPQVSFEEGLAKTVEWYKNNPDWINRCRTGEYKEYYLKQYGNK